MTHRDDVKEMFKWTHDRSWYGKDADNRYYLKACSSRCERKFQEMGGLSRYS